MYTVLYLVGLLYSVLNLLCSKVPDLERMIHTAGYDLLSAQVKVGAEMGIELVNVSYECENKVFL